MRDQDYILVFAAAQGWIEKHHLDPVREPPVQKVARAIQVARNAPETHSTRRSPGRHRMFDPKAIAEYAAANPTLSQTEVAAHFGCAQTTVSAARRSYGMSLGRGVFVRVPWKKYGRQLKRCMTAGVDKDRESKQQANASAEESLVAARQYAREQAQIRVTVAIAKAALAERHPGPFCSWASKAEREFCSNPATQTDLGPRCLRHAGLLGFGICSYDVTKY